MNHWHATRNRTGASRWLTKNWKRFPFGWRKILQTIRIHWIWVLTTSSMKWNWQTKYKWNNKLWFTRRDLSFLVNFKVLKTLILDKNEAPNEATFPYLPELQILWLNNCNIFHMTNWINRLQACCPNLRQLSLLGNPGISSTFNGGTAIEHFDYRWVSFCYYSIGQNIAHHYRNL